MNNISEQEVGDVHIIRKSIFPLIVKLILINLLALAIFFIFGLLSAYLKDNLDFWSFVFLNTVLFIAVQMFFGTLSVYIVLKWLSELYIIKFPEITVRTGIITIDEKTVIAGKVADAEIQQSLLGKMFDYGNIKFEKAINNETALEFYDVPDPKHLVELFKAHSKEEVK